MQENSVYDVIIVGAGIAGMTAAIYASRAGKKVLVLEEKIVGGQIITTTKIKNYPGFLEISGTDLMKAVKEQVVKVGAEIKDGAVLEIINDSRIKKVKTDEGEYETKTVILAIGREEEKLKLSGEDKLAGISYCATCDGALYAGKKVAVIGGGNTALYDALYLADIAEKVYLIHRREEFRGEKKLVEELKEKENVEFIMKAKVVELMGNGKLEGIKLDNGKVIEVSGAFVAIGQKPKTEKFSKLVELNDNGYIIAGEDCRTSCSGVYVAGDCRTKELRQLVTAAADGAIAATEACKNCDNVI